MLFCRNLAVIDIYALLGKILVLKNLACVNFFDKFHVWGGGSGAKFSHELVCINSIILLCEHFEFTENNTAPWALQFLTVLQECFLKFAEFSEICIKISHWVYWLL